MEKFIKTLREKGYEYMRDGDKIIVTHNGYVDLRNLKELPENITFANRWGVYLRSLKKLPETTKFANGGSIDLCRLKELPENITFANKGCVYLYNLKELPGTTTFINGGNVNLRNLETLPENITFANKGCVYLCNLETLPKTTKFANNGRVMLNSLGNKTITYNGKPINIIVVDGYTMIVKGQKSKGDFTIYNTEYLVGSNYTFNSKCIIAEKGGYFAHGDSIKEAIEDVNFKYLQETLDVKQLVKDIKDCGYITSNDYRLLTGACRLGVNNFMELNNITDDKLPIDKARKLVKGNYGYEKFMELLG